MIHHPLSIINPSAFTLIELLVVISVVVLLMAILLPALHRVRNQGQTLACQAKLRQWGNVFSHSRAQGEPILGAPRQARPHGGGWGLADRLEHTYGPMTCELLLCPTASRPNDAGVRDMDVGGQFAYGSTFTAWWFSPRGWKSYRGSYMAIMDGGVGYHFVIEARDTRRFETSGWAEARGGMPRESIPVMFDTAMGYAGSPLDGPPACEDPIACISSWKDVCINRHEGGVNYLFLDWSVRKVGLKELWTLKWYKDFDTRGPWTKAGGVQPEDWPQWMRRFKEH